MLFLYAQKDVRMKAMASFKEIELYAKKGFVWFGWSLIQCAFAIPPIMYATMKALPEDNTLAWKLGSKEHWWLLKLSFPVINACISGLVMPIVASVYHGIAEARLDLL